jgi:hypothetical protein
MHLQGNLHNEGYYRHFQQTILPSNKNLLGYQMFLQTDSNSPGES